MRGLEDRGGFTESLRAGDVDSLYLLLINVFILKKLLILVVPHFKMDLKRVPIL